ncbi:GSCOCG00003375001-RA-CDS [Cotesia congregata]|uniref:MARVEL domain-containing protein n=1 Tax=Cotesia congregata TaxID=51543 RepID=A0A8J2HQC8_COTCN|nr:GSCOCG00003375001-RA-CDS [Cotesia congregata]CAG5108509.1 Protein of unknown function [Cotesia congregata]
MYYYLLLWFAGLESERSIIMSHTITMRTATVTTTTSSIIINTGYLKTYRGVLKLLELLIGAVCVGIMGHHMDRYYPYTVPNQFFLLMVTTFMIATFLLLLSCLISIPTESIISKTIYEVIYHAVAFALLLAASLNLMVRVTDRYSRQSEYELLLGASICGLVNCCLYFFSTIIALRMYRGL